MIIQLSQETDTTIMKKPDNLFLDVARESGLKASQGSDLSSGLRRSHCHRRSCSCSHSHSCSHRRSHHRSSTAGSNSSHSSTATSISTSQHGSLHDEPLHDAWCGSNGIQLSPTPILCALCAAPSAPSSAAPSTPPSATTCT